MISAKLIHAIEEHADDLTDVVFKDLAVNPHTPSFHSITPSVLRQRVHDVYRNLGRWLNQKDETAIEQTYGALGRSRRAEGIPLNEVVFALVSTKDHLKAFAQHAGPVDTAVEMHLEMELYALVCHFFDKVIYHTVKGYEAGKDGPAWPAS